ncbi:unnamed protein product [Ranitomeya imitator]|uniref:Uncharacterized protein n=1 Tax=Ranitomeya imitator TaxID=111125 RepID=A0ABN9M766_9NEOB|nr:unnamed protein product [Ranitomeya imitator]
MSRNTAKYFRDIVRLHMRTNGFRLCLHLSKAYCPCARQDCFAQALTREESESTAKPGIKDGRSIGDITDLYNQKERVTYLYKSLQQIHIAPPEEGKIPDGRSFIIKETVCLKSEDPDLSQCDFKPDGDVKICALDVGDDGSKDIQCISQNKVVRVRRSGKKKKKCNNVICKLFRSGSTSELNFYVMMNQIRRWIRRREIRVTDQKKLPDGSLVTHSAICDIYRMERREKCYGPENEIMDSSLSAMYTTTYVDNGEERRYRAEKVLTEGSLVTHVVCYVQ